MANAFSTNFKVPGTTNVFQVLWKMTRVMKAAGWVVTASSDGYTRDATGTPSTSSTLSTAAATDRWGNNVNPLNDTYPPNNMSDSNAAWIVMSGPKTFKVPLSAAPTGTFIKGETVTQSVVGAVIEGELLGYVWDTVGLTGYAVIMPHSGSFDNTHTVTGSLSGATFVPTGTVVLYGREVMFSKSGSSTVNGFIYYICADVVAESTQFFSAIAAGMSLSTATISGTHMFASPAVSSIAAGSNNVALPTATINVSTTLSGGVDTFPAGGGTLYINIGGTTQTVTYTGKTANSFTGCTGGTGTLLTGQSIQTNMMSMNTLIAAGSNGVSLPTSTINVGAANIFDASGFLLITTSNGQQVVQYTGISGATQFTGCSGGTGTMSTGGLVQQGLNLSILSSYSMTYLTASIGGFPISGTLTVNTNYGQQQLSYSGLNMSSYVFTGLTGTMTASTVITSPTITITPSLAPGAIGTTIAAGSNGLALPQSTITVAETRGFPTSGTITINIAGSPQTITYTGLGNTGIGTLSSTTFTGCTGGTGTLLTGQSVSTFPLKGVCVRGTTTGTAAAWFSGNASGFLPTNSAQLACVNAVPTSGVTADGSFYATVLTSNQYQAAGFIFTRLDETEPADVDPYAFSCGTGEVLSTWNNSATNTTSAPYFYATNFIGTIGSFSGYAARGCPVASRDLPTLWAGSVYYSAIANTYTTIVGWSASNINAMRTVNHPSTTPAIIREPILLYNNSLAAQLAPRQIKGKTRWIQIGGIGNTYDTFDNKTWLAVSGLGMNTTSIPATTASIPAIFFGPYDGITTPQT